MSFTLSDIVQHFDHATFARGEAYARTGKVISVWRQGASLAGQVDGSGSAVYQQSIQFKLHKHAVRIDGRCTCPVSRNCKHVVATLLVSLQQAGGAGAAPDGLSPLADQWASDSAAMLARATHGRSVRCLGLARRLVFALVPDPDDGLPRLQICYARLRPDGSIVSVAAAQASYDLISAPQLALDSHAEEAIRLFGAGNIGGSGKVLPLAGRVGAALLDQLSSDGRLQYAASRADLNRGQMHALRQGPPRSAALDWHADDGENPQWRLQWRLDDGAVARHVFATDPPYYLADDTVGTLALANPTYAPPLGDVLTLVAQAPPLRPSERAAMAQRMRDDGLDLFLPLPLPQMDEIDGDQPVEVDVWYADLPPDPAGGNDWFALELGIVVDGQRFPLLPLLLDYLHDMSDAASFADLTAELARQGRDVIVELDDGQPVRLPWARLQPLLAVLREIHFKDEYGEGARLPFTSAARLAELEAAAQLRWLGGDRVRELGRKMRDFTGIAAAPLPVGLHAQLRPYQQTGLSWLQFLREYGFGGILADDMGLGKTVQTLAHILLEKEAGRLDRPALVVAPTSLMGNWQSEAARFAPGLRMLLLHGKERSGQFGAIAQADLVLTSYALLSRDEAALRQHRYHLLILDEAQYINNSRAKAAQTARLLDTRHRLCLTGTPVQNHLGELWSQFHFLMPGLLGDARSFNAGLRKPIEQQGDAHCQALLNQRVKPFMLRRTKDKVATELPPKTTIVLPVELGSDQRDLYEAVRVAMDQRIKDEIDRRGLARSQIVILDALLKLRQVCCDPRLLKKPVSKAASAKLATLLTLLDTLRSEGRKVLIFSQFTSMLALIGAALQERAIAYVLLTGDTVDRAAPIAAFQNGQVDMFLISLKAGGVGLNLTAADTVIHYDPWWNPASENQATDRAWRIGQNKPVFVYKLIASGTLEEKIQQLQQKKGALAGAILDADDALAKGIGAAEMQAFFSPWSPG